MGWIVILLIALIILVVWLSRRRRPSQNTSRQLTTAKVAGKARVTKSKTVEIAPPNTLHAPAGKGRQPSREASKYRQGSEVARSYVRYDWERIFGDSIRTLFPDELSPALPYLYEAYRLEKEGADQQKVQELLEKAREVDSKATSFYLVRRSIMRTRRKQIGELE